MTELWLAELDAKIAPIAGLVEGVDFGKLEHQWSGTGCLRCSTSKTVVEKTGICCHKSPPAYHESLDWLVPVVRKACEDEVVYNAFCDYLLQVIVEPGEDENMGTVAWRLLFVSDNPARLLAEALVEAVGGGSENQNEA